MKAYLCLQDGTIFAGESIGLLGEASGELCFNSSITGYQEIITDPTCCGQIVVFTYPLIGNYGVNMLDDQSPHAHVKGVVVKELAHYPSNYRASQSLHSYLVEQKVVGIKDVDTRTLTKYLRDHGTMMGLISPEEDAEKLREKARQLKPRNGAQLVEAVTTRGKQVLTGGRYPVVVMDFGVKRGLVNALRAVGCQVALVNYRTTAEEILALQPWGVFLSNGPGDPRALDFVVPVLQELLEKGRPIMGVGMGHSLLGMVLGGKVSPLKHGHRGNYPVKDLNSNRILITAQNHGYVLERESLTPEEVEITHLNLHDQTVEGLRHRPSGSFSVQFNPEAHPGPQETAAFFHEFVRLMAQRQKGRKEDA